MIEMEKVRELARLHDEAFEKWMSLDGHRKRAEGQITLHLTSVDDRREGMDACEITGVDVYAYVCGPSRSHHFATVDAALQAVCGWHKEAMEYQEEDDAE